MLGVVQERCGCLCGHAFVEGVHSSRRPWSRTGRKRRRLTTLRD
uniref:Uncharacterized protein n=1 Tax=Brassica campestris TaxID=3711 RepID=A0A3P5Z9X4_BRACM|nr:unnamed protein product [Brassica rapa]